MIINTVTEFDTKDKTECNFYSHYVCFSQSAAKCTLSAALKLNFLDLSSKNIQIPSFIKIGPVGSEIFHADRLTEEQGDDEANSLFSQFCERA